MHALPRLAAPLAAFVFALALAAFGARFDVYSQLRHPPGLLGASAVPGATAFNLLAYVLPGLLAALPALALRRALAGGGWMARIGAQALLLSALAFAAQGLLPLDSNDIDAPASRLHAAAWTAWWIAFAVAGVLLAGGTSRGPGARSAWGIAGCALATPAFALLAPALIPAGLAQRLAIASWFLALWLAGRRQP